MFSLRLRLGVRSAPVPRAPRASQVLAATLLAELWLWSTPTRELTPCLPGTGPGGWTDVVTGNGDASPHFLPPALLPLLLSQGSGGTRRGTPGSPCVRGRCQREAGGAEGNQGASRDVCASPVRTRQARGWNSDARSRAAGTECCGRQLPATRCNPLLQAGRQRHRAVMSTARGRLPGVEQRQDSYSDLWGPEVPILTHRARLTVSALELSARLCAQVHVHSLEDGACSFPEMLKASPHAQETSCIHFTLFPFTGDGDGKVQEGK